MITWHCTKALLSGAVLTPVTRCYLSVLSFLDSKMAAVDDGRENDSKE
jgi:hypothetical protein